MGKRKVVKPTQEIIDFSTWPVAEQQQAYDELAALLGVQTTDPANMTDAELTATLASVVAEMKTRSVGQAATLFQFGNDHLFSVL